MTYDDGTARAAKELSDHIDQEGLRLAKSRASESTQSQPGASEQDQGVFDPRPTPISLAVHTYLASLPRQPSSEESMLSTDQLLSCIRNPQLSKLLRDVFAEQGLSSLRSDELLERQAASSLQLAARKLADDFLSRSSLIHNLSSRLQRDISRA